MLMRECVHGEPRKQVKAPSHPRLACATDTSFIICMDAYDERPIAGAGEQDIMMVCEDTHKRPHGMLA